MWSKRGDMVFTHICTLVTLGEVALGREGTQETEVPSFPFGNINDLPPREAHRAGLHIPTQAAHTRHPDTPSSLLVRMQ